VLDGKDIVQLAVEPLSPDVIARAAVEELGGNPDAAAIPADTAFDHIVYAERRRDPAHVGEFTPVPERRIARDHEELPDAAERRDEVLRDPVDEEVLFWITRHVG